MCIVCKYVQLRKNSQIFSENEQGIVKKQEQEKVKGPCISTVWEPFIINIVTV